jgi:hypothetical protein
MESLKYQVSPRVRLNHAGEQIAARVADAASGSTESIGSRGAARLEKRVHRRPQHFTFSHNQGQLRRFDAPPITSSLPRAADCFRPMFMSQRGDCATLRDCELAHIACETSIVKYRRGQERNTFDARNRRTGNGAPPRISSRSASRTEATSAFYLFKKDVGEVFDIIEVPLSTPDFARMAERARSGR